MDRTRKRRLAAGLGIAFAAAGTSITIAAGEPDGTPAVGAFDRDRAVAAALAFTGGGVVLEAEAGDDGAAYGVEIRTAGGRVVEVHLDAAFAVIGSEADD